MVLFVDTVRRGEILLTAANTDVTGTVCREREKERERERARGREGERERESVYI
jgi:hypothetical protein